MTTATTAGAVLLSFAAYILELFVALCSCKDASKSKGTGFRRFSEA